MSERAVQGRHAEDETGSCPWCDRVYCGHRILVIDRTFGDLPDGELCEPIRELWEEMAVAAEGWTRGMPPAAYALFRPRYLALLVAETRRFAKLRPDDAPAGSDDGFRPPLLGLRGGDCATVR